MGNVKRKMLRPSQLHIDHRFQRELDSDRAMAMAENFDPALLGMFIVSLRPNGVYVVIDGQHRKAMCEFLGRDYQVPCDVHEGLSRADEASLFLRINGSRVAVRIYDKFRARLEAKDPEAVAIDSTVDGAGLSITKTSGRNCIAAIKALELVHRRGHLPLVLGVLTRWADDGDPGAFEGAIIKDVSSFFQAYPDADAKQLIKNLGPLAPETVSNRIKRTRGAFGDMPRSQAAVSVIRQIYNHRIRGANKLPPAV